MGLPTRGQVKIVARHDCYGPEATRLMRSVPWRSLRGRSGARHPRHARYRALRVAAGGSAPLFPSAPRHGLGCPGRDEKTALRPNQKTAMTGARNMASSGATVKRYVTKLRREIRWIRHNFRDRSGYNSTTARRRDETPPHGCGSARLSGQPWVSSRRFFQNPGPGWIERRPRPQHRAGDGEQPVGDRAQRAAV